MLALDDQIGRERPLQNWGDGAAMKSSQRVFPCFAVCVLCLAICLMIAAPRFVSASDSTHVAKMDGIFSAAGLKSDCAPGAAVLVIRGGKVVFERGYGVPDLDSFGKIGP